MASSKSRRRRARRVGDEVEGAPPGQGRRGAGMQGDRQGLVLDRARVVPELLLGQSAELVELGRRLAPGQQGVARPDDVLVALQLPEHFDAQPVGVEVSRVDREGRLAGGQRVLLARLAMQQPGPMGVVQGQDGAPRRLEPDGLLQVGQGPGPLGRGPGPSGRGSPRRGPDKAGPSRAAGRWPG